jgi:hypothetical protein
VPANKLKSVPRSNLIPSATASGFYQTIFVPYDLSSIDEEYLPPDIQAEMKAG